MYLKLCKFFLYLAPLTVIIVYQGSLFPFIVGKYVFFRTVIGLALIFFIWAWARGEIKIPNYKFLISNPLVIAVSSFALIFLLAGFFGYNPPASFWSNFERGEGGLQMIHFFIFFFLLTLTFSDEKSWRRMFFISALTGILVIAYGVAGALNIGRFIGANLCVRFSGSLGNPSYTGTYLIFSLFYSGYLMIQEKQKFKKWLWIGPLILFFVFLLLTQTRGALFGLGAAFLVSLSYLFWILPSGLIRKIILASIAILIAVGSLGIAFRRSINLMPFCPTELGGGNRILDVSFSGETYQTRLLLWQEAFKAFKERPILGWGPENASVAIEKYYDPRHFNPASRLNSGTRYSQVWFDRVHNTFLDYLVSSGILGLISFLGIFVVFYWQFFRNKLRLTTGDIQQAAGYKRSLPAINYKLLVSSALLFSLPIAYLVQGLVLFDVLPIYINLFLFLAFANYKFSK